MPGWPLQTRTVQAYEWCWATLPNLLHIPELQFCIMESSLSSHCVLRETPLSAGSALVRVHSALSVLAARKVQPWLGNVTGSETLETVMAPTEALLCTLFCLCRRAQLDPAAVASCPPVLLTFLWILSAFHRSVSRAPGGSYVLLMQHL